MAIHVNDSGPDLVAAVQGKAPEMVSRGQVAVRRQHKIDKAAMMRDNVCFRGRVYPRLDSASEQQRDKREGHSFTEGGVQQIRVSLQRRT